MANYVDVDVRIIAEPTAILDMAVDVANSVAQELREGYIHAHLQDLLDSRVPEVPEVDGLWLDCRSHIFSYEILQPDTLYLYLEQPHNTNLSRLQNWAKTFDPESKVLFVTNYFDDDLLETNDQSLIDQHPDEYCYSEIE